MAKFSPFSLFSYHSILHVKYEKNHCLICALIWSHWYVWLTLPLENWVSKSLQFW